MTKKELTAEELKAKYEIKSVKRTMIIDLLDRSLEETYYWLTTYLNQVQGYKVEKMDEAIAATVASSFFSELGNKRTIMEKRAKEILIDINTVVKSILNLVYDLKEFDRRLEIFEDIHSKDKEKREAAEIAIKSVWMDEVDVKRGLGSINQLSSSGKLEFVTLRDAFLQAKNVKDVEKLDLNKRVKRIVAARLEEYEKWRKRYETDLRQRRKIEKAYLKAQVRSLKEYTTWAKPYLIAAKKLKLKEIKPTDPDLISSFDTETISIEILAKKQVKASKYFKNLNIGRTNRVIEPKDPVYACIGLDFIFGSHPALISREGGSHYRHMGQLIVTFRGYVFTKSEYNKIKEAELKEELELVKAVDEMTVESLNAIQEDLKKYLEEKDEKPKIDLFKPIKDSLKGAKDLVKPLTYIIPKDKKSKLRLNRKDKWLIKILREEGKKTVNKDLYSLFKIYRKAHGYITFRG